MTRTTFRRAASRFAVSRIALHRPAVIRSAACCRIAVASTLSALLAQTAQAGIDDAAAACLARSAATAAPVVELYTSEGCSSCPPADRWLSRLKPEADVVALAFHVDYWNRLGWTDRFSNAAYTQRQSQTQQGSGARFSYTPQVIVDGADRPDWPSLAAPLSSRRGASAVDVTLARGGNLFTATVAPRPGAPARLAAYWAVTENGHVTTVKAGENDGATLHHDHVVREYRPVAAWSARADAPVTLKFEPAAPADPAHAREVNLVVVNAESSRPLQAVKLGC